MKFIYKKLSLLLLIILPFNYSCKEFLKIDPPKDKIAPSQVFENDEIAVSAITGIYSRMVTSGFSSGDRFSVTNLCGLSADELKSHNTLFDEFYHNEISTMNSQINGLWTNAYSYIYSANAILEGLQSANGVTENMSKQLQGEAKFIRAFCYFYLVNLFGEVPLNLNTDYRVNEIAQRSSQERIYEQIILDLIDAGNLLSDIYITTERIRPNKWAARALLSRAYLYTENWRIAEQKATEVINQEKMYSLVLDLNKVFLKNSSEAIWQLMPNAGTNTKEGNLFILTTTPANVSLPPDFITNFESADSRKDDWIKEYSNNTGKYYYPTKYEVQSSTTITEYSMVIRLAELHLIRAEALAEQEQIQLALDDINIIRKRAGLIIPLVGLTKAQCLAEIQKQRRLELFTEWGHRWLDLKRTGSASVVLSSLKGNTWKVNDVLYPIPESEISRNRNIEQNLGY